MNIIFFQNQFCTRALKQAIALKPIVDRLVGITSSSKTTSNSLQNIARNIFNNIYNNVVTVDDLTEIVKFEKPDIIHCHNYPDTQAYIAINANLQNKYKVVHDIHDHGTYQYKVLSDQQKREESYCEKYADAFIFVSNLAQQHLSHDRTLSNPSIVIHSMPNKSSFPKILPEIKNDKLVYQGGMHSMEGHHRNYIKIFKEITDNNFSLDIFSSTIKKNKLKFPFSFRNSEQKKIFYDYKNINNKFIQVFKSVPINSLYNKLTNYNAGISILNSNNNPYQQLTLPNKIFEYTMCGLPSIVDNKCRAIMEYVKMNKIGIIVENWSKFDYTKLLDSKQYIMKNRYNFCMENEVNKLVNLYKLLLNSNN